MPELPEVETIVRHCRPHLEGRRVLAFHSQWPKNTRPSLTQVRRAIVGQTVQRVSRRAKFIVLHLADGGALLVHLRMSGRLEWADECADTRHVRAQWDLDSGRRLLFCDARKFGRLLYTRDLAAATADLGPEPLARGFTPAVLADVLSARRRQLKPLLLDQTAIAGLGNIYTDEALFRAGLHPLTRSDQLNTAQVHRLHGAIRDVLRLAIRKHGTSLDWIYPGGWMQQSLAVYGRTGAPCRQCGTPIVGLRIGQRGTHVCPKCQRPPRRRKRDNGQNDAAARQPRVAADV
jgi:formamidopyrimidine-DNA glycosylase